MASLLGVLKQRFFDANGDPLAGGKVFSYQAGTSTPLATYTDESGSVENPNPTILDANGQADIWVLDGNYKFVVTNASDIVQFTVDNVTSFGLDAIPEAAIADGAVTEPKIASSAVTTAKIADDAVTSDKIDEDAVNGTHIANDSITNAKILDKTIARGKLANQTVQISSDSGLQVTPSGSDAQITNCSVTITTTGGPVFIGLIGKASVSDVSEVILIAAAGGSTSITGGVYFTRAGNTIMLQGVGTNPYPTGGATAKALSYPPSAFSYIDSPAAGTHTYTARVYAQLGSQFNINHVRMIAYEL